MLPRQLKPYSTSRRKLLYNFVQDQAERSRKDSIQSGSKSSTNDAQSKAQYHLREPLNVKYFEDENDTEDFSPDCSEYIPSPERKLPDSRSTSSPCTDLQDADNIISSSTSLFQENDNHSTSSLGGDSLVIDNLLRNEIITQSPSTVSNLSLMLGETDFVASPTVIYKKNFFYSPKKQDNTLSKFLDVTLTPVKEHEKLAIHNSTETTDHPTNDNLQKTLTPIRPTSSDSNITISDLDLIQKNQETIQYIDEESNYVLQKYEIEITIEPESPKADSIIVDKFIEINTNSNKPSDIEDTVKEKVHEGEQNKRLYPENDLSNGCEIKTGERSIASSDEENNNKIFPKSINQAVSEGNQEKIDVEGVFLEDSEENVIEEENYDTENLDPLDLEHQPSPNSVEEEPDRLGEPETPTPATPAQYNQVSDADNQNQLQSKKLTRKRKADPCEWRDNKNKKLKNSGQAYEGARNKKYHPNKSILPNCNCKKGCWLKFNTEDRLALHSNFYKLASREFQWQYITRHVKSKDVKRITVNRKNNRSQTLKYHFPLNNEEIQVCKVFFLNTLSITEQMIYTALEKSKKDESLIDKRGKHQNRPHQMKLDTEESIKRHIDLLPKVESHYTRKESKREYLSESLNISKMYRLYKTWFGEQNYPVNVEMASKRQYERVFNTNYNLSFFKPKKDQCTLCSQYQLADFVEKASLEENYRRHLSMKERVREIKNEEKKTLNKDDTVVAIFDLEKVLNVPQSEVSIFHYKRKYPIYNFTVFDALNKLGFCYVWQAQIGKKGCIEIGSCLLQFIKTVHEKGIRKIIFYSDGCYGQNKNRYIFALYLYVAMTLQIDITHRFFVSGHSQNEGDSMHACIERALKNKVLYTPDQVYSIIMNAKISGDKYTLKEMQQSEILNIKELVEPKRWLQDKTGEKVRWSDVMEVSVSYTKPDCFLFKYDFGQDYIELDYDAGRSRQRRQKQLSKKIENIELKPAYDEPLPIRKALYDDLLSLCNSKAIPEHYQSFYKNLKYCDTKSGDDEDSD